MLHRFVRDIGLGGNCCRDSLGILVWGPRLALMYTVLFKVAPGSSFWRVFSRVVVWRLLTEPFLFVFLALFICARCLFFLFVSPFPPILGGVCFDLLCLMFLLFHWCCLLCFILFMVVLMSDSYFCLFFLILCLLLVFLFCCWGGLGSRLFAIAWCPQEIVLGSLVPGASKLGYWRLGSRRL